MSLVLIALLVALVFNLFFFINLFRIFDVTRYRTKDDFTISYNQEFGGIEVDFRMTHSRFAQFDSILIFKTISSEDIEEIGITEVSYDIYTDDQLIWYNDLNFNEPVKYDYDSFILNGIHQHDNISCVGAINAKFNVEGIVQNETINFVLSIIMPVNPLEIRDVYFWNLIWIEYGLGVLLIVLIGFITKVIQTWRREATYTEAEKKREEKFWEYIDDKLEKFKKDSS
ncbi:MAG: hypothetical protein V3V33_02285 [Candidatus Lokiarchaeia archaeon]